MLLVKNTRGLAGIGIPEANAAYAQDIFARGAAFKHDALIADDSAIAVRDAGVDTHCVHR